MRLEHLYAVDLSLLVVLQVLLEEGSVTRAAGRLGRSQPAISRALQRLRELLDDPLFVRDGLVLSPTPRALALRPALEEALSVLDRQILSPPVFDPATAEREIRIVVADFAEGMWLPAPLATIAREAPGIDVVLMATPRGWGSSETLRTEAHLAVLPIGGDATSIRAVHVGTEDFVVLLRRDHPARDTLDLETYASLPHLLVAPRGTPGGIVDGALAQHGLTRRVAMRTRHFHTAPALVAASDLVVTLPRRFALSVAPRWELAVREPPLAVPPFDVKVAWHERWHHDAGHRWVREVLVRSLREALADHNPQAR